MEISSLIMEIMREKNIMRDRKWNFPPYFCIIRDGKCQKQGRKITFWGIFFPRVRKNAKMGKEFSIEGKKLSVFTLRSFAKMFRQSQIIIVQNPDVMTVWKKPSRSSTRINCVVGISDL